MSENDNRVSREQLLAALDSIADMAVDSLGSLRPEDAEIVERSIRDTMARVRERLT